MLLSTKYRFFIIIIGNYIGDVSSSAGQGISSANSATAAASTAQSAIDDMETQVDLTAVVVCT